MSRRSRFSPEVVALMLIGASIVFLFYLPYWCWKVENQLHTDMVFFHEIEEHIQSTKHCRYDGLKDCILNSNHLTDLKSPIHVVSNNDRLKFASSVTDDAFGITLQNALALDRTTEYCQWKHVKSGKRYKYVKKWRDGLFDSSSFPARYMNSARDPFPSTTFVSLNAKIGDMPLDPTVLKNANSELRAARKPVSWSYTHHTDGQSDSSLRVEVIPVPHSLQPSPNARTPGRRTCTPCARSPVRRARRRRPPPRASPT